MPGHIPFGEWMPDQDDRRSAALEAKGVVSISGNYAPLYGVAAYAGSNGDTTTTALGLKGVYDSSNNGQIFAGDTAKLYQMQSSVLTNVSKSGGYTVATDAWWMFEQFGDYVVAVATGAAPQVFQMGTSSAFSDLGGSPPSSADSVARVNDFLMLGKDFTVHWSAFNDITDWTPSATTQAGNQLLDQAQGHIQTIVGGDYAVILQERAIRRALYVGPPVIWDFGQDAVETKRGAVGPFAADRYGRTVFFAADDGFYAFDGQSSQPIGQGKVDDYYRNRLNYGYRHQVQVAVDTIRRLVFFGIPADGATDISELLIYSLTDGRWTHDDISIRRLSSMPVESYTVDSFHNFEASDDLDTVNLDPYHIDSNAFDEKRRLVAGFDTANDRLFTLSGPSRAAVIETGEFEIAPGRRAEVRELWPVGNFGQSDVSMSVGRRSLPGSPVTYSNATAMNRAGFCPQRVDGRFLRGRMQLGAAGSWSRAIGVHHDAVETSER